MSEQQSQSVEIQEPALDFLPDDYVIARARARANRLCGALLAIVIVSVAGAFGTAELSLKSLREQHANVTAEFERESARLEQLDTLRKQQQAVSRRATLAEALVERTTRTALLAELTALLPDGTSLSSLTLTSRVRERVKTPEELAAAKQASRSGKAVPAVVEPKRYNVALKLGGFAYTDVQVAQFISRLARSRCFDDVNLLLSKEVDYEGQLLRHFEVEMAVRAAPLPDEPVATTNTEGLQ